MRIAIVQDSLIRSGAERQAMYTVRELTKLGCEVELIYYNKAVYAYDAAKIVGEDHLTCVPKRGTYFRFLWRLRRYFRQRRFDVVHGFMSGPAFYTGLAGWLAGVPVVLGGMRVEYDVTGLYRFLHRLVNRVADGWIVNSQATARSMVPGVGADPQRVFVVYNGLDPATVETTMPTAEAKKRLGLSEAAQTVSIIGRLDPQKNHGLFIAAAERIAARRPDARFLIVGEGKLRAEIESRIRGSGLTDRVLMLGNRSDMPEILAATDVCVLTSHYEGLANVLLEAMCVGIPVVCTAYNGADELVTDGKEGFLAPLNDADGVAERILRLLGDPELRRRMGEAGRESVRGRFSLEAMGRNMLSVYERCLALRRGHHDGRAARSDGEKPASEVSTRST